MPITALLILTRVNPSMCCNEYLSINGATPQPKPDNTVGTKY